MLTCVFEFLLIPDQSAELFDARNASALEISELTAAGDVPRKMFSFAASSCA